MYPPKYLLKLRLILFTGITLLFAACGPKNDPTPSEDKTYVLTVTAYNAFYWSADKPKGNLQANARVNLYTSREDYYAAKPYQTTQADANGKATFTIAPGKYFIVAEWQGTGKLASSIVPNEIASTATLKKGYVQAGLFQSTDDVTGSPVQAYAKPGNFKWQDINGDGIINANDLVELPSASVEITNSDLSFELVMGGIENELLALPVTKNTIYNLLDACVAELYKGNNQVSTIDAILSDDADCAGFFSYCNLDAFAFNSTNGHIFDMYATFYKAIRGANLSIQYASYIELNPDEKAYIEAESKALRGYAYLTLTTYFGQAAIMTKPLTYGDVNPVFSPRAQVLVQAAKDLAEASNELPFPSNYYRSGHISKYGAKALSARLSLLAKNYADAKAYSEEVLNGPFSFSANVTDVFNKLNDPELIWSYPSDTDGPPVTTFLPGQGKYHPFIRLAEMYLTKAEAMIYGGQFKDARNPLLILAARRGVAVPEFDTQQTALDALYEISRIETYREGRRYANLVRWGIAGEVLLKYREHNNILPIPYQEIAKLPGLIQNPGYK